MVYYSHRRKKKGRHSLQYTRNSTHEEERGKANTFVSHERMPLCSGRPRARKRAANQRERALGGGEEGVLVLFRRISAVSRRRYLQIRATSMSARE